MFTIVTNYKKILLSFIKSEFSLDGGSDKINNDSFSGDSLSDLKALKKALLDGKIDSEEALIISSNIDNIEGEAKEGLEEIAKSMLDSGFEAQNKDSYESFREILKGSGFQLPGYDALLNFADRAMDKNYTIKIKGEIIEIKYITSTGISSNRYVKFNDLKLEHITRGGNYVGKKERRYYNAISDSFNKEFNDLNVNLDDNITEEERLEEERLEKERLEKERLKEERLKEERERLGRVRGLIKRYRGKECEETNYEKDEVVRKLYDTTINIKRKTTYAEMDAFEKAMDNVDIRLKIEVVKAAEEVKTKEENPKIILNPVRENSSESIPTKPSKAFDIKNEEGKILGNYKYSINVDTDNILGFNSGDVNDNIYTVTIDLGNTNKEKVIFPFYGDTEPTVDEIKDAFIRYDEKSKEKKNTTGLEAFEDL